MALLPVDAPITQNFAANPADYQPTGHTGVDFGVPVGTVVRSVDPGTVLWADWCNKLPGDDSAQAWLNRWYLSRTFGGILVLIDHGTYMSVYAHLNETALNVGDRVERGSVLGVKGQLGKSGTTGMSTGPHLHWEVIPKPFAWGNGWYGRVNPLPYRTTLGSAPTVQPAAAATTQKNTVAAKTKLDTSWIDETRTALRDTLAADVPAAFLRPRRIKKITIHHWGDPQLGQTHDGVVAWFCNDPSVQTSAHFVASAGRAHCIVSSVNAAWHAGSAEGNAESIGIECHPAARDGDYATIARLIACLRDLYGNLPLVQHSYWTPTACPGAYDLARLDREARAYATGAATKPAPAKPAATPKSIEEEVMGFYKNKAEYEKATEVSAYRGATNAINDMLKRDRKNAGTAAWLWDNGRGHAALASAASRENTVKIAALTAAVEKLAAGQGYSKDDLTDALRVSVGEAMESMKLAVVTEQKGA